MGLTIVVSKVKRLKDLLRKNDENTLCNLHCTFNKTVLVNQNDLITKYQKEILFPEHFIG